MDFMTLPSSATHLARAVVIAASVLGSGLSTVQAAEPDDLFLHEPETLWFVRAGGRALFNVRASISQTPTYVTPGVYEDGFVLPDINGSGSPQTWNWGYQNASQVTGNLLWQSRTDGSPMAGQWNNESNPSFGPEIITGAELIQFEVREKVVRVGFEVGYAFNPFSVDESSTATGTATRTFDAFATTGGIALPTPPYSGTEAGPGPLINLSPSVSSVISSPSQATFDGELESHIHTMKLGFWIAYPLTERLNLSGSLGYSSIFADTELNYTESVAYTDPRIPDVAPHPQSLGSHDWRSGMYMETRLEYSFSDRLAGYMGGEFQFNEDQDFSGHGREVTLDFGAQFSISAGLGFRF